LGIDIMLPAFASLREHFGFKPESTATAQIIVFFFMGQIAQLFFGIYLLQQHKAFVAKTKIHIPSLRFYKYIKTERGSARPEVANCCEFVFYMENKFEHEMYKPFSTFQS